MSVFYLIPFINIAHSSPIRPRSVNLDFITTVDINSKENNKRTVLDLIKSIFESLYQTFSSSGPKPKEKLLELYLIQLGKVIKGYTDDDFKSLMDIFVEHIVNHYTDKEKYNPIIYNPKLRMYVTNRLKGWKKHDSILKLKIAETVKNTNKTGVDTEFLGLLSQIFSLEDLAQFQGFLNSFYDYPKHKNKHELHKVVRDAIDFTLIKRYKELDHTAKEQLDKIITDMFSIKEISSEGAGFREMRASEVEDLFRKNLKKDNVRAVGSLSSTLEQHQYKSFSLLPTTGHRPISSCAMTTGQIRENRIASNAEVFVDKAKVLKENDLELTTIFY